MKTADTDDAYRARIGRMLRYAAAGDPHGQHRVYAEVWIPSGLGEAERVSWGRNGNDPIPEYAEHYDNPEKVGHCAEAWAVKRAAEALASRGSTVLVTRAKKTRRGGRVVAGESSPCPGCEAVMRRAGVERVYCTTDDGSVRLITYTER